MTSTKEDVKSLSPDLYTILRDILYNAWLIVLAFALGVMGTYVVLRQTYLPQYTSSVTLIVRSRSGTTSNYNNLSASMEMTEVFAEIFLQPTMLEHAARALGEEAFQGKITTEAVENTNILFVRVTGANPTDAFRELSAVLDVYPVIADAISANAVVDVIQQQSVPKAPDNPFTWKDTGIKAGAVCAILTLAAVVLMSYLRDTVKNESDYTKKIGEKLVGSVVHATRNLTLRDKLLTAFGRSRAGKRALMIRSDSGGFLYTENFQKIATKLEYMRRSMDKKIFMFTSVAENEGKSTVTSNLALSLAERGNRVLLMDFDFRKPALYKIFEVDVPRETELGELLSGKLDVREFRFLQYRQSSLFLAINRHAYYDYADWMASPDVRAKLDLFRNMFDYILIDTPPVYAAPDVVSMTSLADVTMLVLRTDVAEVADVNDTILEIRAHKGHFGGCILNDVHRDFNLFGQTGSDESGYYKKGYGYGRYGKYGKYGKYGRYGNYGKYGAYDKFDRFGSDFDSGAGQPDGKH